MATTNVTTPVTEESKSSKEAQVEPPKSNQAEIINSSSAEKEKEDPAPEASPVKSEPSPEVAYSADLQNSERSVPSQGPHIRSYSDLSSVAGVGLLGSKDMLEDQTGSMVVEIDKSTRKQSTNPVGVKMVQIPNSDSASLASLASNLESVGAATLAEQRLHASHQPAANAGLKTITPTPSQGNMAEVIEQQLVPTDSLQEAQHIQQENIVTQSTPVLVAVPLQESGPDGVVQQSNEIPTPENGQQQQTVLYQIPGVMTLPVGRAQESSGGQVHAQHPAVIQQQIPQSGKDGDVVGMVGTIPVVKLQGGTVQFVKKKKGRFKFLQDAPQVSAPTAASVPSNIAVPAQMQSTNSIVSQLSAPAVPQQGDIASAPKVKKKGRFVLSSVNDPIPNSIQTQNPPPPVGPLETPSMAPVPQLQQQQQPSLPQQNQSSQVYYQPQHAGNQVYHQLYQQSQQVNSQQLQLTPQPHYMYQNAPGVQTQEFIAHLSFPTTTFETQFLQPMVQQNNGHYVGDQTTYYQVAPQQQNQYQYQQYQQPVPQQQQAPPMAQQQQQQQQQPRPNPPSQQQQAQQQQLQVTQSQSGDQSQQLQVAQSHSGDQSQQMPRSAPTENHQMQSTNQGGTGSSSLPPTGKESSPGKSRQTPVVGALPNVPVPKPPVGIERPPAAQQPIPPKKPSLQKRAAKPQGIGSNGMYGHIGVGKLSYLVEQMKSEVADTDRMIKHLQTDTKIMRDKNKELEAKNRELERKLKEESALREKAEARFMELRKKVRSLSSDSNVAGNGQETTINVTNTMATASGKSTVSSENIGRNNSKEGKVATTVTPETSTLGGTTGQTSTANGSTTTTKQHNLPPSGITASKDRKGVNKLEQPQSASVAMDTVPSLAKSDDIASGKVNVIKDTAKSLGTKSAAASPSKPPVSASLGTIQGNTKGATSMSGESRNLEKRPDSQGSNPKEIAIGRNSDTKAKTEDKSGAADALRQPCPVPPHGPNQSSQMQRLVDQSSKHATPPPTPQSRPPPVARSVTTPGQAKTTASIDDFDPLRPRTTSTMESEVFPVISFPTNMSLGTVPLGTAPSPYFQQTAIDGYSTTSAPMASDNQYVVPITFEMTASNATHAQHAVANGFQMSQPYVLSQPIMLQNVHGGTQQSWPASASQQAQKSVLYQESEHQQYHNPQHQQQQQHNREVPPSQAQAPCNPFDPLGG